MYTCAIMLWAAAIGRQWPILPLVPTLPREDAESRMLPRPSALARGMTPGVFSARSSPRCTRNDQARRKRLFGRRFWLVNVTGTLAGAAGPKEAEEQDCLKAGLQTQDCLKAGLQTRTASKNAKCPCAGASWHSLTEWRGLAIRGAGPKNANLTETELAFFGRGPRIGDPDGLGQRVPTSNRGELAFFGEPGVSPQRGAT